MFAQLLGAVKYIVKKADMVLLGLCLVSTIYGIVLIASATHYTNSYREVIVQGAAAVIGLFAYFIFSVLDMEHYSEKWQWFLLFNLGFIALLLTPLGTGKYGNKAWLTASWLPTSIQPAEIVKLTFTVLLARQMAWFRDNRKMRGFGSLFWPAAHAGLMFVWIVAISSDAGSGLVYLMIYAGMALAAGLAWYWFAAGLSLMGIGVGALVLWEKLPSHILQRFIVLFDHSYAPDGVGWQQTRSILAIGSGGIFGQGYLQGIQTQSPYETSLPARHTDEIFAVCGEEFGLVGCILLLLILAAIILRCVWVARRACSPQSALIAMGYAGMLLAQVFFNVGMCLYILPVMGLTLPFFSYGGSSIITLYTAMGIVSSIRARTLPSWLRDRNQL